MDRQQREWDEIADMDALWAILSAPDKRGGRWDTDGFLETGREEIEAALARAAQWGVPIERRRALDFGCGVGRLTAAMNDYFEEVVGVDISRVMVDRARQLHEARAGVRFQTLSESPLSAMSTRSYDFIYSNLVLQHMDDSEAIDTTVGQFGRLLAPHGLLIFQVPNRVVPRRRLQARPRLYRLLRRLRVPHDLLYRRFGLHPIRMRAAPEQSVVDLLQRGGAMVLSIDRRVVPETGLEDRTYYATVNEGLRT